MNLKLDMSQTLPQTKNLIPVLRLILSSVFGFCFFLLPISYEGQTTVLFDILTKYILTQVPTAATWYCFSMIVIGGFFSVAAYSPVLQSRFPFLSRFSASKGFLYIRVLSIPLAISIMTEVQLWGLLNEKTIRIIWYTLTLSVGVIIPIGGAFLNLWVSYGVMELIGTLMKPSMRRLFHLPGRSAIDNLTSWLGSYSVGLYLTSKMLNEGYYTRREAFTIATCFSTVSIGFVGVVAVTLEISHLFFWIFASYFISIYLLTAILVRMWPILSIPNDYLIEEQSVVEEDTSSFKTRVKLAWNLACETASKAPSISHCLMKGFYNGCLLASTTLGTILLIGFCSLLFVQHTNVFQIVTTPLVPVLKLLGIPNANDVAPAVFAGISEIFIPALMVTHTAVKAKFFIATLSISQLIFFSSCAPMMLSMFRKIPITFAQLVALFFLRTAILVPIVALITNLLEYFGILIQ